MTTPPIKLRPNVLFCILLFLSDVTSKLTGPREAVSIFQFERALFHYVQPLPPGGPKRLQAPGSGGNRQKFLSLLLNLPKKKTPSINLSEWLAVQKRRKKNKTTLLNSFWAGNGTTGTTTTIPTASTTTVTATTVTTAVTA